jgi:hypothetical protein
MSSSEESRASDPKTSKVFYKINISGCKFVSFVPDKECSESIRSDLLKHEAQGIIVHEVGFNPTVSAIKHDPYLAYTFVLFAVDMIGMAIQNMLDVKPDKSHIRMAYVNITRAQAALESAMFLIEFQQNAIDFYSMELFNMFTKHFIDVKQLYNIKEKLHNFIDSYATEPKTMRYCMVVMSNVFPGYKSYETDDYTMCPIDHVVVEIPIEVLVKNFILYRSHHGTDIMVCNQTNSATNEEVFMTEAVLSYYSLIFDPNANVSHKQLFRIVE